MNEIEAKANDLYNSILGKIKWLRAFPEARWKEFEEDVLPVIKDICLKATKFDALFVDLKNTKLIQEGKSPTIEFSILIDGAYVRYRVRPVEEFQ